MYIVGAEAIPDLDIAKRKYCFRILLPSSDETGEVRMYFDTVREREKDKLFIRMFVFIPFSLMSTVPGWQGVEWQ